MPDSLDQIENFLADRLILPLWGRLKLQLGPVLTSLGTQLK